MKKLALLISILAFAPLSAFAWGAIAITGSNDVLIHSVGELSAADAEAKALSTCNGDGAASCRIVGRAQINKMMVVYVGESGNGFGADVDHMRAAEAARKDCLRTSKNCAAVYASWAGELRFASMAFGSINGYNVVVNSMSQEKADQDVMQTCKARAATQKCVPASLPEMHKAFAYAVAADTESGRNFVTQHPALPVAQRLALANCKKAVQRDCAISIKPIYNVGSVPATREAKAWLAGFFKEISERPSK